MSTNAKSGCGRGEKNKYVNIVKEIHFLHITRTAKFACYEMNSAN